MRISCRILLLSEAEVNYASTIIVNVNVFISLQFQSISDSYP